MLSTFGLLLTLTTNLSAQWLTERATFKGHTFVVNKTALSPDGKILASGGGHSQGGELKLWDTTTGKEIASLSGYTNTLMALAFSADGKRLASGGLGPVQVWDVGTHKELAAFKDVSEWVGLVALGPDGKKLAAVGWSQVKFWDLESRKELASFRHTVPIYGEPGQAFSNDLSTLAVRNYQEIDLWDMATGKLRATLSEHRGEVDFLRFSIDGKTLLAASQRHYGRHIRWQGDLKLWDVATRKERTTFKGPFGLIRLAELSPDGKFLALLDTPEWHADPDLKLLDVASGQQQIIPNPPGYAFLSLSFRADGRLFAIGTPDDKILKLWEVSLPGQRKTLAANSPHR
jgi:WD40 repeat protein